MKDPQYIQHALRLAAQGIALVSPNPMVGSIVVKDGEIVGRGFHRYDELKHAEAWALEEAGERARGATVYVNLEPCSHQGAGKRTPPCVRALVEAGVARVVASMVDPNPRVNGRGFDQLIEAGIEVVIGVLERDAQRLNEKYVKYVTTGFPFVHLKTASTLDGRIATRTGDAKWITGEESRAASHLLRREYDAILIGIGTALADDPMLTDRTGLPRRRPLARAVLDSHLRIQLNSQLVQSSREFPLLIFTSEEKSASDRRTDLESAGIEVIDVPSHSGMLDLSAVLRKLSERRITSLIVEGGSEVSGAFIERRLVDKATFFISPRIIGGRDSVPSIGGRGVASLSEALQLSDVEVTRRGEDIEITGYPDQGESAES